MALAETPHRPLFHAIPVFGWIARDLGRDEDAIWYLLVALVSLLIIGVKTWGLAVLAMSALALVPVMFAVLLLITRG